MIASLRYRSLSRRAVSRRVRASLYASSFNIGSIRMSVNISIISPRSKRKMDSLPVRLVEAQARI